uniref:hypothetical protein n=1 Tax=Tepidiforma flava TaxID=3004094 RepID=UPI003570F359
MFALLLVGAVGDEGGAEHHDAEAQPRLTGAPRLWANSWLRMNCSTTDMPAPPYSFGQAGAIQPRRTRASRHWPKAGSVRGS